MCQWYCRSMIFRTALQLSCGFRVTCEQMHAIWGAYLALYSFLPYADSGMDPCTAYPLFCPCVYVRVLACPGEAARWQTQEILVGFLKIRIPFTLSASGEVDKARGNSNQFHLWQEYSFISFFSLPPHRLCRRYQTGWTDYLWTSREKEGAAPRWKRKLPQ